MERLHDRPFQDFVAHETHRLILQFKADAPKSMVISSDRCGLLESARLQSAHAMFNGQFTLESITSTVPGTSTNLPPNFAAAEVCCVHVGIGQTVAHGFQSGVEIARVNALDGRPGDICCSDGSRDGSFSCRRARRLTAAAA